MSIHGKVSLLQTIVWNINVKVNKYSPVERPIAPIRMDGIAMTKQPKAAVNDNCWALV